MPASYIVCDNDNPNFLAISIPVIPVLYIAFIYFYAQVHSK